MRNEPGTIRAQQVNWISKSYDRKSVLVSIDGRVTLAVLQAYLSTVGAPDGPTDVTFSGNLRWERPATDEERAERARWEAAAAERHAVWERRVWATLVEKFGPGGPPAPEEIPEGVEVLTVPPATDGAGRQLPGTVWTVTACFGGVRVTQEAEHKLSAMEAALNALRAELAELAEPVER